MVKKMKLSRKVPAARKDAKTSTNDKMLKNETARPNKQDTNKRISKIESLIKAHHTQEELIKNTQGISKLSKKKRIQSSASLKKKKQRPEKLRASKKFNHSKKTEKDFNTKSKDVKEKTEKRSGKPMRSATGIDIRLIRRKRDDSGLLYDSDVTSLTPVVQYPAEKRLKLLEEQGIKLNKVEDCSAGEKEALMGLKTTNTDESEMLPNALKMGVPEQERDYLVLITKNPNSAANWLKLIAFSINTKSIIAARLRAEQALKTISYRLEKEKLAIWSAFMAMELKHGTDDTFDEVKRRALAHMDKEKVWQELATIYARLGRNKDAEETYTILIRKYADNIKNWVDFGQFYHKIERAESAKSLMQRSLRTLPTKDHVEVIAKFAQQEFKHNSVERATEMFENILSNFPKRTDIWSMYLDMLCQQVNHDKTREVFNRLLHQNLNTRKLRVFYKRFLDFEHKNGTKESVHQLEETLRSLVSVT